MNIEEFNQIDQYLSGEMKSQERLAFEARLAEDAELRRKLELQRDLLAGMDYHYSLELKKKLQAGDTPVSSSPKSGKSRPLFPWVVGIAATFLLLLLAGYFYVSSTTSPTDLYAANYQPYPNIINPLERSGAMPEDTKSRALIAYEKGAFEKAIRLFQEAEGPLSPGHHFYLGLSYLEIGNQNQAIARLQKVIESEDQTFYLPALWYQGLAYLSAQEVEAAEEVLKKLTEEEDSTYYERAQEILSDL